MDLQIFICTVCQKRIYLLRKVCSIEITQSLMPCILFSLINLFIFYSFINSLIHSSVHPRIRSSFHLLINFIHPFTYPLNHSSTHLFIHSFIPSFIPSFIRSFVLSFILTFTNSIIHFVVVKIINCFIPFKSFIQLICCSLSSTSKNKTRRRMKIVSSNQTMLGSFRATPYRTLKGEIGRLSCFHYLQWYNIHLKDS